jgi:hypothetical protein
VETAENRWNLNLNHWANASAKIGKAPRLILVGEHAHAAIQSYIGARLNPPIRDDLSTQLGRGIH